MLNKISESNKNIDIWHYFFCPGFLTSVSDIPKCPDMGLTGLDIGTRRLGTFIFLPNLEVIELKITSIWTGDHVAVEILVIIGCLAASLSHTCSASQWL